MLSETTQSNPVITKQKVLDSTYIEITRVTGFIEAEGRIEVSIGWEEKEWGFIV